MLFDREIGFHARKIVGACFCECAATPNNRTYISQSSNGCCWRKAAVQGIQAFAAYAGDDKKLALTESGRMPGFLTRQPLYSSFQKIVFEPSSGENIRYAPKITT
jgi:hypothetical protein